MLSRKKVVGMICLLVILAGCGGNAVTQAYKALYIASQAYDTGMKSVADLQAQGRITAEQRSIINASALRVYASIQLADINLSIYNRTKSVEDKTKVLAAMTALSEKWPDLVNSADIIAPGIFKPLEVK